MTTSTIVKATNVTTDFNNAIAQVVSNSQEANEAITLLKEVMRDRGAFECVVAGGVYRDALLGYAPEDIDVFVYGEDQDSFESIYNSLGFISKNHLDTSGRNVYGANCISIRVGNINLIKKHETLKPERVLEQFSSSCSKIGVVVDGYSQEDYLIYCDTGMRDLLLNNKVEFFTNGETYAGLRPYINKLSKKPWAKGYLFESIHEGFTDSVIVPEGGLSLVSEYPDTELLVCYEVLGIFAEGPEISQSRTQMYRSLNMLSNFGVIFSLLQKDYKIWASYFRYGINLMLPVDQVLYLEEVGLKLDVRNTNTNFDETAAAFDNTLGRWSKSQILNKANKAELLGWDLVYVNNLLPHEEAHKLWTAGKKRLVLQSATRLEVFLSAYGLNNKIVGTEVGSLGYPSMPSLTSFKRVISTFGVKAKLIGPCIDYEHLKRAIVWSSVVGGFYKDLDSNTLAHPRYAENHIGKIPAKYHAQLAKTPYMCSWVFEHNLEVEWNKKDARSCIISALEKSYPKADTSELLRNPSLISVFEFIEENPTKDVEHNFIDVDLSRGSLSLNLLDKKDPINLYIGDLTSCCQKLNGYGDLVCREGWNDEHSVNYVFRSVTSGTVVAHMWVWRDTQGNYVIDSIEGRSNTSVQDVSNLVMDFTKACKKEGKEVLLSQTSYGLTRDVVQVLKLKDETTCQNSITPYGYKDASIGFPIYSLGGPMEDIGYVVEGALNTFGGTIPEGVNQVGFNYWSQVSEGNIPF